MYNREKRIWVAGREDEELLRWAMEPANQKQPEARFIRADALLAEHRRGSEAADGVYEMEEAAKAGYAPAVYAMGQMFQWGWAVHRDRKRAMGYYQRAAELGYKPAAAALAEVRRQRLTAIAAVCGTLVLCAAAVGLLIRFLPELTGRRVIRVNAVTELTEPATLDEFAQEISSLIAENDTDLMISGQVSTNRVILRFDGNRIDLSDFLASRVIARDDNLIVIQFASEEEANACLAALSQMSGVVYAQMDQYTVQEEESDGSNLPIVTTTDPQSGHYSWGTLDMGLDQLSDYVAKNCPDRTVVVAVIDEGTAIWDDRVLSGINVTSPDDPIVPGTHGTHVTGIIVDGTRGTNTVIFPVDTYGGHEGTNALLVDLGIRVAVQLGVDVISMSQGWPGHTPVLEEAVQFAVDSGVVFVKSAGNNADDSTNGNSCPAELEGPIVVGAYNINHEACDFTNYGTSVDVCAPGEEIYSWSPDTPDVWIALSGTSMAAPHVAALAALVKLMYPDATPAQVELYIEDYCRTNRNPNLYATGLYGAGAPDATCFIETE